MQLLLDHGYLTEDELATGQDEYDENEAYTPAQLELARERVCAGAVSIENNETRLRVAIDLVRGSGFYRPCGLMIACMVYENWARCFSHGVLVRHSVRDRRLGGHALVLLGFMRIEGLVFAVLLNSWAGFAAQSPIGISCALVPVDYLSEIMFHGALYFCQTKEEWLTASDLLRGGEVHERARRSVFVLPAVALGGWWKENLQRAATQSRARLAENVKR